MGLSPTPSLMHSKKEEKRKEKKREVFNYKFGFTGSTRQIQRPYPWFSSHVFMWCLHEITTIRWCKLVWSNWGNFKVDRINFDLYSNSDQYIICLLNVITEKIFINWSNCRISGLDQVYMIMKPCKQSLLIQFLWVTSFNDKGRKNHMHNG